MKAILRHSALFAFSAFGSSWLLVFGCGLGSICAASLQFGKAPAELVISEVSERTVRVTLSPLDENEHSRSGPSSAVLVSFPSKVAFRARELTGEKNLEIGGLRVAIRPEPLTVSVRDANGKLVQELVFSDSEGTNAIS